MPILQPQRYETILARMISRVVTRAGLTDMTDSSAVKHILAAAARELDDANFQLTRLQDIFSIDTAVGADLDERAKDVQPSILTRNPAQRAVGYLVFFRAVNNGTTITIPAGTTVKTASGVIVQSLQQATITNTSLAQISGHSAGQDAAPVAAIAQQTGSAGNIASNTAVVFASRPSGVDGVTNVSAFVQGQDQETDDAFRARIKLFIASLSRSTVDALKYGALGVADPISGRVVTSVSVVEDPINRGNVSLYIDDGTGASASYAHAIAENVTNGLLGPPPNSAVGGEQFLYLAHAPVRLELALSLTSSSRGALTSGVDYVLNLASGLIYFINALATAEVITADYWYFTGLVAAVQQVIDGVPSNRAAFPGYRAAGVIVRVLTPVVLQQTVQAVLFVTKGFDRTTVNNAVSTAISSYINNLPIGQSVIRNTLIEDIMLVPGVQDVTLSLPAANIAIQNNQIAKIISGNILLS